MLPSCVKCRAHHSPLRGRRPPGDTLAPVKAGAFAVVATGPDRAGEAADELRARGAASTEARPAATERVLVYGAFAADDGSAEGAVRGLRSNGWSAVVRPAG